MTLDRLQEHLKNIQEQKSRTELTAVAIEGALQVLRALISEEESANDPKN